MLSLRFVVLALAAVAEAGKLYGCAGTCIGKAITATGCSSSNSQCICSSVQFMESIKNCTAECTEAQTESALTVAEEFCNLIGSDLPQLTHEKRGGHGGGRGGFGGRFRGGHGHPRPEWSPKGGFEGAPWWATEEGPAGAPAAPGSGSESSPAPGSGAPEFPDWSAPNGWGPEGEGNGRGGRPGGGWGRPGGGWGRPGGGQDGPGEGGNHPGGGWGRPGGPPPPVTVTYTEPGPTSTGGPAPISTGGPKHPQPPPPAHTHSGTSSVSTGRPTWTTSSGPAHTVW